jgi:hypothetical protein
VRKTRRPDSAEVFASFFAAAAFLPAAVAIPVTLPMIPFFVFVFLFTTVVVLTDEEALLLLTARVLAVLVAWAEATVVATPFLPRTEPDVAVDVVEALAVTLCRVDLGFSGGGPIVA